MTRRNNTLILFSKTPHICRVKTRLRPHLTHRECLYLHKKLTHTLCESLNKHMHYNFVLYTTSNTRSYMLSPKVNTKIQHGNSLGMRMHNAITEELKHAQQVILIGSDCVEFSFDYIIHAFNTLNKESDVVLTPTNDGGYSLIGTKKSSRFLFENITWSSDKVLAQTKSIINANSKKLSLLPEMHDIDTFSDLLALDQLSKLPAWAKCFVQ